MSTRMVYNAEECTRTPLDKGDELTAAARYRN
jgi:hypothetical protein